MKFDRKAWIIIGIIITVLSFIQAQEKKEIINLLPVAAGGVTYGPTTWVFGAAAGTAMLPTPAAPIGMILLVISGIMLFISYLGFKWISSNLVMIIIVIAVFMLLKTIMRKKQYG